MVIRWTKLSALAKVVITEEKLQEYKRARERWQTVIGMEIDNKSAQLWKKTGLVVRSHFIKPSPQASAIYSSFFTAVHLLLGRPEWAVEQSIMTNSVACLCSAVKQTGT